MFDLLKKNELEAAVAYFEVELPGICVEELGWVGLGGTADLLGRSVFRPGFEPTTCEMKFIIVTA